LFAGFSAGFNHSIKVYCLPCLAEVIEHSATSRNRRNQPEIFAECGYEGEYANPPGHCPVFFKGGFMSRERTGFIIERNGKIYVRLQFTDPVTGKRREFMRGAKSREKAEKLWMKLLREIEEYGETSLEGDRVTFDQLADEYQKKKLVPAKVLEGKKVAGMKSLKSAIGEVKALREYFGKKRI